MHIVHTSFFHVIERPGPPSRGAPPCQDLRRIRRRTDPEQGRKRPRRSRREAAGRRLQRFTAQGTRRSPHQRRQRARHRRLALINRQGVPPTASGKNKYFIIYPRRFSPSGIAYFEAPPPGVRQKVLPNENNLLRGGERNFFSDMKQKNFPVSLRKRGEKGIFRAWN